MGRRGAPVACRSDPLGVPIRPLFLAALVAVLVAPQDDAHAGRYKRVRVYHHHTRYGPWQHRRATGYGPAPCDGSGGGSTASDGSHVYFGMIAVLPGDPLYGRTVQMRWPIHGRRLFKAHDHIGSGSVLDVWLPCGWLSAWDNPRLTFRTVRVRTVMFHRRVWVR